MAESSSQEKTEEATPKRLRDARKKGQVAKSRDLNTIIILIAAFALIVAMRGYMADQLRSMMQANFGLISTHEITPEVLFLAGQQNFMTYVKIVGPYVAVIVFVAIAVGFFQIGPIFSGEPMKPQVKRLNAVENLKNMFKIKTLVELLKNVAKMACIFLLAYLVISDSLREVALSVTATPEQATALAARLITSFLLKVFVVFIAIALIDLAVQRWTYKKQMRMSKDEVKREYKQDEGDPLIKSMRRQLHQELAMGDTRQAVKSSDAVITNPTEIAVAVKYDDSEMVAPQVLAKGQRLFAQTIRELAEELDVPIVQNPPLAWTLIELDIGDEIPEELYAAVAEMLVFVYRLKKEQEGKSGD